MLAFFFDFSGHELVFRYGKVDDDGSAFVFGLVEFFDDFFAGAVFLKLYKSETFVALRVVGVAWDF